MFEFKKNKAGLSQAEILKELSRAQQRKDELVARTVNRFLSQDLQEEGMNKLRNFITKEVKRNIQKILLKDSSQINEFAFNKSFVKSFASRQSSGGQLYLYSAAWNDGVNVYGSGSLSEQYASNTSYHVTTTLLRQADAQIQLSAIGITRQFQITQDFPSVMKMEHLPYKRILKSRMVTMMNTATFTETETRM